MILVFWHASVNWIIFIFMSLNFVKYFTILNRGKKREFYLKVNKSYSWIIGGDHCKDFVKKFNAINFSSIVELTSTVFTMYDFERFQFFLRRVITNDTAIHQSNQKSCSTGWVLQSCDICFCLLPILHSPLFQVPESYKLIKASCNN